MANLKKKLHELKIFKEQNNNYIDLFIFNQLTFHLSYSDSALLWFQLHLNQIVTSEELAQIYGKNTGRPISHNIRRVFELRDEKGYNIVNHNTKGFFLKKNEWMLLDEGPIQENIHNRGINKKIRMQVFKRDNYTCQICGRSINDSHPFNKNQKITLHVGHIYAHKRKDGSKFISNRKLNVNDFITMCNVCNEGLQNDDLIDILEENENTIQSSLDKYLT